MDDLVAKLNEARADYKWVKKKHIEENGSKRNILKNVSSTSKVLHLRRSNVSSIKRNNNAKAELLKNSQERKKLEALTAYSPRTMMAMRWSASTNPPLNKPSLPIARATTANARAHQ